MWNAPNALLAVGLALALTAVPAVAQERRPLSVADLEQLLPHVPRPRIVDLVKRYGVDFEVTSETEARLRELGADEALLQALEAARKPNATPVEQAVEQPMPTEAAPPTSLIIRSNVSDDEVLINGKSVGQSGPTPHDVGPGRYEITVQKEGYETAKQTVDVADGQTATVRLTLRSLAPTPSASRENPRQAGAAADALAIPSPPVPILPDYRDAYEKTAKNKIRAVRLARGKVGVISAHHGLYVDAGMQKTGGCSLADHPLHQNPMSQAFWFRALTVIWSEGNRIYLWVLQADEPSEMEVLSGPLRLKETSDGVPIDSFKVRERTSDGYEEFSVHFGANVFQVEEYANVQRYRCEPL